MPQSSGTKQSIDAITRAFEEAVARKFDELLATSLKQQGFTATLKSLKKGKLAVGEMMSVRGGVAEKKTSGLYDAALDTDEGPLFLEDAKPRVNKSTDPQWIQSSESYPFATNAELDIVSADNLLQQLAAAGKIATSQLIYQVEVTRFERAQHDVLLPLLWRYILAHRDSNNRGELAAAGAAIRKYIAVMPMNRMGELAVLLESGHKSTLPIDLEIEVAKMVYRNFEVSPPCTLDTEPELAGRLWEMVQAYINPRVLLRDKHSAVTSFAIEAIVAMRSSLAAQAWQAASDCPYRWFAELVSDNLDNLHEKWRQSNPEAADWLGKLRSQVAVDA